METNTKEMAYSIVNKIKNDGYKAICFWLPARSVGGGSYLFAEYAKYIASNTDLRVYYCDFSDGYGRELLANERNITFIDYEREEKDFILNEPIILFTNTTRVIHIKKMHPKSKIMLWHWETNPVGWDLLFFRDEKAKFFQLLLDKKAICFHDWSSWDMFCQQSGLIYPKNYLPLFLPHNDIVSDGRLISTNEINLCWIGRLSFDKTQSLFDVIKCFARYKTDKIKRIHIIGDGLCSNEVVEFCKKYKEQIEFIFTGTIAKNELSSYLIEHVDCVFAMGTAALEAPAIGIPSAIVKLSYKPFFDEYFVTFPNVVDYCVGFTTDQAKRIPVRYTKFDNIIDLLISNGIKEKWGRVCLRKFESEFDSIDNCVRLLLKSCSESQLCYDDLRKAIKYTPYNNVKSIMVVKKSKFHIMYIRHFNVLDVYLRNKLLLYRLKTNDMGGWVYLFGIMPVFWVPSSFIQVLYRRLYRRLSNLKPSFCIKEVIKKDGYVFPTERFKG